MLGSESIVFCVKADVGADENVYVLGDKLELGEWNPRQALMLKKTDVTADKSRQVWYLKLDSKEMETFSYRYFIGRTEENDKNKMSVSKWETNISPRVSRSSSHGSSLNDIEEEDISIFGQYGGCGSISPGWLMDQTEIQIRLHSNPIYMWKANYRKQTYCIRCNAVNIFEDDFENINFENDSCSINSSPKTSVSILEHGNDSYMQQSQHGKALLPDSYMIFKTQTFDAPHLGFQILFYSHDPNAGPDYTPSCIGCSFLVPFCCDTSNGSKMIPIVNSGNMPIGQLKVEYFIANPLRGIDWDMKVSYQNYWTKDKKMLEIGHRGMGESYSHEALARENTICSFNMALDFGADLVEFDAQLSKDFVPVIFHDFTAGVLCRKKASPEMEKLCVPIKDLMIDEIHLLKVTDANASMDNQCLLADVDENEQPFPTLECVFQNVDKSLGFNIEVKYPLMYQNGEHEQENFFEDRNKYIDSILSVVMKFAGRRKIIFSSFDPDSCILLKRKQNKYPVMLLTMGDTKRYTLYEEPRTRTVPIGIHFAKLENFLGMVVYSEELVRRIDWIKDVKDAGLVCFSWGQDNNNKDMIRLQKQHGVDGVIFDRLDCYSIKS